MGGQRGKAAPPTGHLVDQLVRLLQVPPSSEVNPEYGPVSDMMGGLDGLSDVNNPLIPLSGLYLRFSAIMVDIKLL